MTSGRLRKPNFQSTDDVIQDVRSLLEHGYDRGGSWTLGQICEHLEIFFEGAVEGMPGWLPAPLQFIPYWLILRRSVLPKRRIPSGVKAPKTFMPEPTDIDDEAAANSLIKAIKAFDNHGVEYHPHPVFGKLNRAEWYDLNVIHSNHHLSFLRAKQ